MYSHSVVDIHVIPFQYQTKDDVLNGVEKFKDLGVAFDQKFTFNDRIVDTVAKS